MRVGSLLRLVFIGLLQASPSIQTGNDNSTAPYTYPTRVLANVTVIDTPLVRAAQTYARAHSSDVVWSHVMRGWLYGSLILTHNATLRAQVDPEVQAVAAILHDLGWDQTPGSETVSADRRFEVDGAIAACEFIHAHHHHSDDANATTDAVNLGDGGSDPWDESTGRTQLVWDAIALHTQDSIYMYKQPVVMVVGAGILIDFAGPAHGVTREEYDAVVAEFPKIDFVAGVNRTLVWLCRSKPATTYDTFMQPWGDDFVANYSSIGKRAFDLILGGSS
ncbi:Uu.00g011940.m01.CDS01 [Anthostomella pinea]|uniref:Uu.00g011940.m01.CDS01 n=1 Tax=Anthostomella pinea TaxID=933095 RepID=A0AAI8VYG6_9PEZI|nr:Uu.00g011940.m01.CDS01 [Anthostomella pinea]